MENVTQSEKKKVKPGKVQTIIGIVLCVILGIALIFNLTIIVKGSINPEKPPSIFSVTPLIVETESMEGNQEGRIDRWDIVLVKDIDFDDLKIGDIVTFRERNGNFVTHRFVRIDEEGNYRTKGDNPENDEDDKPLTNETLYGIVVGRIPKLGGFANFLKSTWGRILFIGLPLVAFILYDVLRRQISAKKTDDKTAALEAELERLRALAGEVPAKDAPASVAEAPVDSENAPVEETADTDTATGE